MTPPKGKGKGKGKGEKGKGEKGKGAKGKGAKGKRRGKGKKEEIKRPDREDYRWIPEDQYPVYFVSV